MSLGSPEIYVENPFKKILKFITFSIIALALVCLLASNFMLYHQVEVLSEQIEYLQKQNIDIVEQYDNLSVEVDKNYKRILSVRDDLKSVNTEVNSVYGRITDRMVKAFHVFDTEHFSGKHKDTEPCYYCTVFNITLNRLFK